MNHLQSVKTYSYTIANAAIWLATLVSNSSGEYRNKGRVFRKKNNAYSSIFEITEEITNTSLFLLKQLDHSLVFVISSKLFHRNEE